MHFKTAVSIERPIEEVFDYVSDARNFPRWNSAVQSVNPTSGQVEPGSTYLMERELPGAARRTDLKSSISERPMAFAIRTTSGPTPFVYRYRFDFDGGATQLELTAEVELSGSRAPSAPAPPARSSGGSTRTSPT
jgi:uncharacterized protein YndB with AHSA1/START domain